MFTKFFQTLAQKGRNNLKRFTLYSKATKSGGGIIKSSTTKGGGATLKNSTTRGGGGVSTTTRSGGATTRTSSEDRMNYSVWTGLPSDNNFGNHQHRVQIDYKHGHTVDIPSHTHDFTIPSHSHDFTVEIENHSHDFEINIDPHEHDIEHGIFELDRLPTAVEIKVDGNTVPHTDIEGTDVDLIPYLSKDSSGKIKRGWHEITIRPDDLARIEANIFMRVFIRTHLGGRY